jgi:hypothetical protein
VKRLAVALVVAGLLAVAVGLRPHNGGRALELRCSDGSEPEALLIRASTVGKRDAQLECGAGGTAVLSGWQWKEGIKLNPTDPAALAPERRRSLSPAERRALLSRVAEPGAATGARAAAPDGGDFAFSVYSACQGAKLKPVLRVDHYGRWPDSEEHYRQWLDHPLDVRLLRRWIEERRDRQELEPFAARSLELIDAAFSDTGPSP